MNEKVEKPITMIRQEFIDKLVDDVNNCNLPLFIVEPILKDIYTEVKFALQKQCEAEKFQYENEIQKRNENKNNDNK